MTDKKNFGEYIAQKRKERGLTQEELAEMLYVIPTTISKWERGVSYPDITMVVDLCKALNMSEHEFFIACDDLATIEIKRKAKRYTRLIKATQYGLVASYIIGIIVCFICNLILDHKLSWFFIVLLAVSISFVLTNFVFYLKEKEVKNYGIKSLGIVTGLIYLLLFTCNRYTQGNWLFSVSYPIATFELGLLWLGILIIRKIKQNLFLKGSIAFFFIFIITIFTNPLCEFVLHETSPSNTIYTNIVGILFLIGSIICFIINISKKKEE